MQQSCRFNCKLGDGENKGWRRGSVQTVIDARHFLRWCKTCSRLRKESVDEENENSSKMALMRILKREKYDLRCGMQKWFNARYVEKPWTKPHQIRNTSSHILRIISIISWSHHELPSLMSLYNIYTIVLLTHLYIMLHGTVCPSVPYIHTLCLEVIDGWIDWLIYWRLVSLGLLFQLQLLASTCQSTATAIDASIPTAQQACICTWNFHPSSLPPPPTSTEHMKDCERICFRGNLITLD